ncbi:hypothetical protein J7J63_01590 [Candidatus Bipolaricaulota bacterium]|nr:hypothetical protein [Candidatus Bipolaricaulota bacterium]
MVEQVEEFVPNNLTLDEGKDLVILTGPNMAGKSVYLRQNALIALMAQIGSFVPATAATLPIIDRIFARVGASDMLISGISTFMMEMLEVATILKRATRRSLIILDEMGRGTNTFDGVSIAWAVARELATHVGAKTLFATHYQELTRLAAEVPSIVNQHVAVKEMGKNVVFLHRVEPGVAAGSYGVHVARLASRRPPSRSARSCHRDGRSHLERAIGGGATVEAGKIRSTSGEDTALWKRGSSGGESATKRRYQQHYPAGGAAVAGSSCRTAVGERDAYAESASQ